MSAFRLSIAILAGMASLHALPVAAQAAAARLSYLVQLRAPPLASQADGVHRLDTDSDTARRYTAQLEAQQRAVLALVPDAPVQYRYTVAFNGFAAMLTRAEVARLQASPDVARVSPGSIEHTQDGGGSGKPQARPQDQR
ncbi:MULTISPECIES: protease inhibitor I9 family protein [unclassified Janthinobacterium]|uniref:protease inhibitor I9 family protein n=1 Tax=unclassified Janthinobacterium TaxID=2610881 RepID=UPI0015D4F975|nr:MULTISPECIES: protease inhibitor I9 family protein [unclassified Janthinobacterium]